MIPFERKRQGYFCTLAAFYVPAILASMYLKESNKKAVR